MLTIYVTNVDVWSIAAAARSGNAIEHVLLAYFCFPLLCTCLPFLSTLLEHCFKMYGCDALLWQHSQRFMFKVTSFCFKVWPHQQQQYPGISLLWAVCHKRELCKSPEEIEQKDLFLSCWRCWHCFTHLDFFFFSSLIKLPWIMSNGVQTWVLWTCMGVLIWSVFCVGVCAGQRHWRQRYIVGHVFLGHYCNLNFQLLSCMWNPV